VKKDFTNPRGAVERPCQKNSNAGQKKELFLRKKEGKTQSIIQTGFRDTMEPKGVGGTGGEKRRGTVTVKKRLALGGALLRTCTCWPVEGRPTRPGKPKGEAKRQ